MSAAEDDTELRDLLIQNLENNGVLNKLKAEMRAAVFLAMEEQDRVENKTPLVNENLKKCLNTKDGRLVASLILDFLQVFHLDFTLAVFQPEMNSLNGLDGRDLVCKELGLSDLELNRNSPVLLELVRRGRHKDKLPASSEGEAGGSISKEPTQKQITLARKKFDFYDKDRSGSVAKDDLQSVFRDLFPNMNKNMLERFVTDELRAADKSFSRTCDFHMFMSLYKRLFTQCRSVVLADSADVVQPHSVLIEERTTSPPVSKIPRYKGSNLRGLSQTTAQDSEPVISPGKGDAALRSGLRRDRVDLEVEDELEDGDSFFDDPMPKPQKTYGRLSLLAADSEGEQDLLSDHRKAEVSGARDSPVGSLMEAAAPTRGGGGGGGGSSVSDSTHSRNGASHSREKGFRDSKAPNDKTGSLHLDDDVEYDDDFNSHRSDLSKSELSIGEEIEEVSIEGPDASDKFDETTQDLSVSQLSQSHGADYMEDVP